MKEYKIIAPEGKEIDEEKLKEGKIEFKDIKKKLPESWEELRHISGWYLDGADANSKEKTTESSTTSNNRNIFPTEELLDASIAQRQLLQLRDVYNDGWKPDYTDGSLKYSISIYRYEIVAETCQNISFPLVFKTEELRDKFLSCPDILALIEIAKPLL